MPNINKTLEFLSDDFVIARNATGHRSRGSPGDRHMLRIDHLEQQLWTTNEDDHCLFHWLWWLSGMVSFGSGCDSHFLLSFGWAASGILASASSGAARAGLESPPQIWIVTKQSGDFFQEKEPLTWQNLLFSFSDMVFHLSAHFFWNSANTTTSSGNLRLYSSRQVCNRTWWWEMRQNKQRD